MAEFIKFTVRISLSESVTDKIRKSYISPVIDIAGFIERRPLPAVFLEWY